MANDVKRFSLIDESCSTDEEAVMGIGEQPDGKFVLHADYATLSDELADVRGVLADVVEAREQYERDSHGQRAFMGSSSWNTFVVARDRLAAAIARAATVKGAK